MGTPNSGLRSTSPPGGAPNTTAGLGLLNLALGMQPHGVIVNALAVKDGDRVLLRLGGDGVVDNWLRRHVGEVVTIIVPSFGVAWTPKLQRRKGGRVYVRVPNRLRNYFEQPWLMNTPLPIIVTIPRGGES